MDVHSRFEDNILPIPIRDGVFVRIAHLPPDLTQAEAERIASIVRAFANKEPADA